MKISTRLTLTVFVPILMAFVIVLALFLSYQTLEKSQENGSLVRQIRTSITGLTHDAYSYILYHEERPKQQFAAEYATTMELIASTRFQDLDQLRLLNSISQDVKAVDDLFHTLVSNYDIPDTTRSNESLKKAEEQLVGTLLVRLFEADSNASRLRNLVDEEIQNNQIETFAIVLLVIILATLLLTILLVRVRRGIISSLMTISKGTEVIGGGNLDFKIEEKAKDEIGDLSRAFNRMTTRLRDTTTSKVRLEKEIEERKKAEVALLASERRWATTLASIGDGVIATDAIGRITFMNEVAEALTGWTLAEASARPMGEAFNIINEHTGKGADNPVDRVLREGAIIGLANHTILIRKDGLEIPIDDSAAPIRDSDGNAIGVVLVFRDITERKKMEQQKDEFIGMVSHEIKTPLTIIMGALSVVNKEQLWNEEVKELLQDAVYGAEALANIVDNLLELSRYQADRLYLKTEQADIRQISQDIIRRVLARDNLHSIIVDMADRLPTIMADPLRVDRIISNLVENAIKYSDGGEIKIFARLDGENIFVGVDDMGPGISPEDQIKLFQPFERLGVKLNTSIQGTGLGLRVCRILVEAHGGKIWVESKKGKGSTFCFTLPIKK
jgi:PAS domain S-box-containing protein